MVSFAFDKYYGSIGELKAAMSKNGGISVWEHNGEVIANHIEEDELVIFNMYDDGSLVFNRVEEFSPI
nr:MAG TPA: hypothetical protein [Bacteriophage sp.]